MSKSAGNFYRLADIVKKSEDLTEQQVYRAFRMMRLQNLYRDSFNFTFDKLYSAHNTLINIDNSVRRFATHTAQDSSKIRPEVREYLESAMVDFVAFLEDDFDTVQALTVLFELLTQVNTWIDEDKLTSSEV